MSDPGKRGSGMDKRTQSCANDSTRWWAISPLLNQAENVDITYVRGESQIHKIRQIGVLQEMKTRVNLMNQT